MQIQKKHRPLVENLMRRLDSSFFYYDLDGLKSHLQNLESLMIDDNVKLWYACKANPMSAILKVFRNCGFGVDVASKGELDQVLSSGVKPVNMLSTGPSKSRKYLRELLEENINIVVCESLNQVYWLNEIATELGKKPDVLLRVQLEFEAEGTSVLGGNEITPFGEDEKTWKTLDLSKASQLNIIGLHAFQWGNILDVNELETIWNHTATRATMLAKELGIELKVLDLGGGIGIPYSKDQSAVDFSHINELLQKVKKSFGFEHIWMELGRYAVGPYGTYMTQVIDRKNVRGREILVLDGGINHIARPALTGQAFPCELFRESSASSISYQINGPLCTAIDSLGICDLPSDIEAGDWLAFHQCGAYGFTEAMPFFLCHNLPAEVIIYEDNVMIPRNPKKSEDWLV
jgi:diaminopimelate decarboxylase